MELGELFLVVPIIGVMVATIALGIAMRPPHIPIVHATPAIKLVPMGYQIKVVGDLVHFAHILDTPSAPAVSTICLERDHVCIMINRLAAAVRQIDAAGNGAAARMDAELDRIVKGARDGC